MSTDLVVRPVRFTDDVDAMRDFFVLLGLVPRIASKSGGWVDLTSGGGMVALHDAASSVSGATPGETTLSFEVGDADSMSVRLQEAGYADAVVLDESYGRVLVVTDPTGAEIALDERPDDLYGYRLVDPGPAGVPPLAGVAPVRYSDQADLDHHFLTALGLHGRADPGGYATYSSGGHGWVGVHHRYAEADALPIVGENGVHLTLAVADAAAVDTLRHRLEAAGVPVTRVDEDFGSFLEVTDPDGQSIQVHPAPEG